MQMSFNELVEISGFETFGLRHLGRIAAAVVLNADQQRIFRPRPPLDPEHDLARGAVAQRVGQAFLGDAVGCGGNDAAHIGEIALQVELDHRLRRIL